MNKESHAKKEITHPCIPKNDSVTFEYNANISSCISNFKLNGWFKFVGSFNMQECKTLIESIITDEQIIQYDNNHRNFANMGLPLFTFAREKLRLYTSVFKRSELQIDSKGTSLSETARGICERPEEAPRIKVTDVKCIKIMYLAYLLENVMRFGGNDIDIMTGRTPDYNRIKLIFADPRIGPILYEESSPIDNEIDDTLTTSSSSGATTPMTSKFTEAQVIKSSTTDSQINGTFSNRQVIFTAVDESAHVESINGKTFMTILPEEQTISGSTDGPTATTFMEELITTTMMDEQITNETLNELSSTDSTTTQTVKTLVDMLANIDEQVNGITTDEIVSSATTVEQKTTPANQILSHFTKLQFGLTISCLSIIIAMLIIYIIVTKSRRNRFERNL